MKKTSLIKSIVVSAGMIGSIAIAPSVFAGNNNCSEYRLSAYGGDAGFRVMSGSRDFRQASNGSVAGSICNTGTVQIELSKRHPGTHVSLALNGREYVFGQGDRGDRHVNNWFRRYINIELGHYNKPQQKPHKWRGKDHNDSDFGQHNNSHRRHQGEYNDSYVNNGYRGRDHGEVYYNDQPHHPNNQYGGGNYSDHSHKAYKHKKLPRYAVHSKRHRKAHRRDIPHRHKRNHGQRYVTYH